jgi:hypothetical protein
MKPNILILVLILLVGFTSCKKKPDEIILCRNCDLNSEILGTVKNRVGPIIFHSDYKMYMIQTASWEWSEYYIPCQFPTYFIPESGSIVEFSGKVIENSYSNGYNYPIYYHCIKLDTIHLISSKKE